MGDPRPCNAGDTRGQSSRQFQTHSIEAANSVLACGSSGGFHPSAGRPHSVLQAGSNHPREKPQTTKRVRRKSRGAQKQNKIKFHSCFLGTGQALGPSQGKMWSYCVT